MAKITPGPLYSEADWARHTQETLAWYELAENAAAKADFDREMDEYRKIFDAPEDRASHG
ncbi:MAG: hypothetical protein V4510_13365 [bacterium]